MIQPEIKYNIRDIHAAYCIEHPTHKMTYDRFKVIFRAICESIMWFILDGFRFEMPYSLGILRITKKKSPGMKRVKVDFAATKKYGKPVYHLNEHSDGFYYRFSWIKGKVKNIRLYSFQPLRIYKRDLASAIKNDRKDYLS